MKNKFNLAFLCILTLNSISAQEKTEPSLTPLESFVSGSLDLSDNGAESWKLSWDKVKSEELIEQGYVSKTDSTFDKEQIVRFNNDSYVLCNVKYSLSELIYGNGVKVVIMEQQVSYGNEVIAKHIDYTSEIAGVLSFEEYRSIRQNKMKSVRNSLECDSKYTLDNLKILVESTHPNCEVVVYSALGDKVLQQRLDTNSMSVSVDTLPTGVYYVFLLDFEKNIYCSGKSLVIN